MCVPGKVPLVVVAYNWTWVLSLELCENKRSRAIFSAAQLTTAPHLLPLLFPVLVSGNLPPLRSYLLAQSAS